MFLVSRKKIESYLKEYYFHCYGIRVIDDLNIHDFFKNLNSKIIEVEKTVESSIKKYKKSITWKS